MLVESALVLFVGQLVYVILYWIDSPQWMIVVLPVTNLYVSPPLILAPPFERKADAMAQPIGVVLHIHHGRRRREEELGYQHVARDLRQRRRSLYAVAGRENRTRELLLRDRFYAETQGRYRGGNRVQHLLGSSP